MNSKTFNTFFGAILIGSALTLTACGGGGSSSSNAVSYSGNTTPAAITSTNAAAIGTSSAEGSQEAVNTNTANASNPFGIQVSGSTSNLSETVTSIAKKILASTKNNSLPTGVTISSADLATQTGDPGFCGGSVSYPSSFGSGGTLNGTMTFNSLCYNDSTTGMQITMSGNVTFTETSTSITIKYGNFAVTTSEGTSTLNATLTCDTSLISCSFSSDFVGSDGQTHRISNYTISGTASSGYTITATFDHATYGEVTISTTTPITFGTCGANGGTIAFSGANSSSGTITFNSDCTYSGTWNDGTASGTF